tara:strand:+ start:1746 stop:2159 length:414 start_codon:yes stop_codon:yes gene_type:complete
MLYYDTALASWVDRPGSKSAPWITPVLTVGATHAISVTFIDGYDTQNVSGATWFLGVKSTLDFAGDYVGSNAAPTESGEDAIDFILDLDTVAAKAYFTANPTVDTLACTLQITWTITNKEVTAPMDVVLQNTYLQDQ